MRTTYEDQSRVQVFVVLLDKILVAVINFLTAEFVEFGANDLL